MYAQRWLNGRMAYVTHRTLPLEGPHAWLTALLAVLKFLTLLERGAHLSVVHCALLIVQLVLFIPVS